MMAAGRATVNAGSAASISHPPGLRTPASIDGRWSVHKKDDRSNSPQRHREAQLLRATPAIGRGGEGSRDQDLRSSLFELARKVDDRDHLGKEDLMNDLAHANSQIRCRKLELEVHRHEIEVRRSAIYWFKFWKSPKVRVVFCYQK